MLEKNILWVLLLVMFGLRGTFEDAATGGSPCRFTALNDNHLWLNADGSLRFPEYERRKRDKLTVPEKENSTTGENQERPCFFNSKNNELICKDSINFEYLKTIKNNTIERFTVEAYNSRVILKQKEKPSNSSANFQMSCHQQLVGELRFEQIHVKLRVLLDMRMRTFREYVLTGEIFSNNVLKVGWKFTGYALIRNTGSRMYTSVKLDTNEYENNWTLKGFLFSLGSTIRVFGNVTRKVNSFPINSFEGSFDVKESKGDKICTGEVKVLKSSISGTLQGRLTENLSMEITIPRQAFFNMSIRHLYFTKSDFFGDFDSQSLEGIRGLDTITFHKSKLEFMPSYDKMFKGLPLRAIYIEESTTPTLTTSTNCKVEHLELLSFKGSGFIEFSNNSFQWLSCSKLKYLNFHDTNFKILGNGSILWPVYETLKFLDISYSTLTNEVNLQQILTNIKISHLSLAGLQLKSVPTLALQEIRTTLEYLSLRNNNFEKTSDENMLVPTLKFPSMPALKELDLRGCQINFIERGAFDNMNKLEKLDLSQNNVINLQDGWAEGRINLLYLDLSHNGIVSYGSQFKTLNERDRFDLKKFVSLEVLDLSHNNLTHLKSITMNQTNNLLRLSLCNCDLRHFSESLFRSMERLLELDLSGNPNLGRTLSFDPLKRLKSLNTLHISSTGLVNYTFEEDDHILEEVKYIDFSNNHIKEIRPEFFELTPNVMVLIFSHNSISFWPKDFFKYTPELDTVLLDNNKIDVLKSDVITDMTRLNAVTLGNNPFVCDCYVQDMMKKLKRTEDKYFLCPEFVKKPEEVSASEMSPHLQSGLIQEIFSNNSLHRRVYRFKQECVVISDWTQNDYQCYSRSKKKTISFHAMRENLNDCVEEIQNDYLDWLYVTVSITILLCCFLGFTWWKWWNFRVFAKMVKNAAILTFMNDEEQDEINFSYDAFISYSDTDRRWVTENLIPNLEKIQDVRLCLHERDFQVGLSILENIITSIDKSKCIILILSQAFVKSQWCLYEMHLAYHRLLETRRDQMILILLEDIPRYKRPKTLQYLMMSKTYIQWPNDPENVKEIELFWNRLFKALLGENHF